MTTLLLASASPARASLLRAAGVDPRIHVADLDEDALLHQARNERGEELTTAESVAMLARAKAEQVAGLITDADLVLGCDSLLEMDGRALGKPGTVETARERWRQMRGRTGVLHTGHWLIRTGTGSDEESRAAGTVTATAVTFADITDDELEAYLRSGEPLRVAGAFTIDGLGGAFVRHIDGDHQTVVGLSLYALRDLLTQVGRHWIDLWAEAPGA
ncbi:Maf family protein [Pseudactinotalea sp. Z1739]|uniref:Maf family protein n=1 Tax=Pseudactinotalea sp. Z1739 TaxID=3413028 RepID=UPI003C7BBCF4